MYPYKARSNLASGPPKLGPEESVGSFALSYTCWSSSP